MNTQTDPTVKARREAATAAFKIKAHDLYHRVNGPDAACHNCGNVPKSAEGFQI